MGVSKPKYLLASAIAIATAAAIYLAESALGINGAESPITKRMELAVFAVAVLGALLARFRASGMAIAMSATAIAQAAAGVTALAVGLHDGPDGAVDVLAINGFFAAMFAASAFLFRSASRRTAS